MKPISTPSSYFLVSTRRGYREVTRRLNACIWLAVVSGLSGCSGQETAGPDATTSTTGTTSMPGSVPASGPTPASSSPDSPSVTGAPPVSVPGAGGEGNLPSATGGAGPNGTGPAPTVGVNPQPSGTGGAAGSGPDGPAAPGGTGGITSEPEPDVPVTPTDEPYPVPDPPPSDEDGAELWLRYPLVPIPGRLLEYQTALTHVVEAGASATLTAAEEELTRGLSGLLGADVSVAMQAEATGAVVLGTPASSDVIAGLSLASRLPDLGDEGYLVEAAETADGQSVIAVAANSDIGVLYGTFALLRHLQMHRALADLTLSSSPRVANRILNHWDNLNRSVERGYAGQSLWNWGALPGTLSERYTDYARANASIGVNGTVLTNVNADAEVLTPEYLDKVAALADVFRPYGIRVYLTARFSAPIEIGGVATADPTNASVQQWWQAKADEIYQRIPDFGGFLVKANSEGQPGPQDYGRTHADGANMLAEAVDPHGGIVMWRAFVYSDTTPTDRILQAYDEFEPLDGQFLDNVLVQVKNGPLDFQPREPFSPLFGAMPQTPLVLELQITKEYLGMDTHLAYLGPYYEEVLQADTYADGAGSTVARVVDGSLHGYSTTAIAGVSNIGSDTNWGGSHFNQANWYVFGRMAWDLDSGAEGIADEWVRQTFSNDPEVVAPVVQMMMASRQALVDYMTPLGLAHIMGSDHHYGPGPWVDDLGREDWNPVYFHKADAQGIGFDRTPSGSNAVQQYFSPLREELSDRDAISEDLLLFFHHVGWQEPMSSGRTLWEELVYRYSRGVDEVGTMRDAWAGVEGRVDSARFADVSEFLQIQHYEARWWRDSCLQYFRTFADLDIPDGYAQPANTLSYYQGLNCPSNVTKPRCDQVYTGDPSPAILP